jgi:uncharacterized membrane protein
MAPFFILMASWIVLRAVGWLGVARLASWRECARYALSIMFLFTGVTHFTGMKYDYLAMIPSQLPAGLWTIYLAGVFEIAGAIGLLIPATRRIAGICLVLLLIAMFPANVNAALQDIPFRGRAPTPLCGCAPPFSSSTSS